MSCHFHDGNEMNFSIKRKCEANIFAAWTLRKRWQKTKIIFALFIKQQDVFISNITRAFSMRFLIYQCKPMYNASKKKKK